MLKDREELYINRIKTSVSLIEVCRKANSVPTTGNYNTLKRIISKNNIDISHFKRISGLFHEKKDITQYLKKGVNVSSFKLKNKLLNEGIKEHKCENPLCGLTEWQGKPIPLELHHINGDNTDNRLENLQLLCPNCHAQTETYGGKNQKLNIIAKQKVDSRGLTQEEKNEIIKQSFESDSVIDIANKTKHSSKTIKKVLEENNIYINKNAKKVRENNEKITSIIDSLKRTKSFTKTAMEFGVSDNAIKKLLVRRGFPKHIKELLAKIT